MSCESVRRVGGAAAAVLLALPPFAAATTADVWSELPDLDNGEEVHYVCATCHGEYAQGGKQGEYPRLAGMPEGFLIKQLRLFRARERTNMPMLPHTQERELPDADIRDVAAYISRIELPTELPPADPHAPGFDAYERMLEAQRLMQIPRAAGDAETGGRTYRRECGSCHGRDGEGDHGDGVPMLAGQYTDYLWRQVDKYLEGTRIHDPEDPEDEILSYFTEEEIRDIFAYVSTLDDQ